MPVEAKWFTFFYGDWLPEPDGSRGKPTFSSYLELSAHHDFDQWGRGTFGSLKLAFGNKVDPGTLLRRAG